MSKKTVKEVELTENEIPKNCPDCNGSLFITDHGGCNGTYWDYNGYCQKCGQKFHFTYEWPKP